MSLKFRKRVRVFPGFYLNLSKSGMSATVGMRGLNVNVGKKGTYLNTGIPGTGIYDRVKLNGKQRNDNNALDNDDFNPALSTIPDDAIEIKSYQPELVTRGPGLSYKVRFNTTLPGEIDLKCFVLKSILEK